MSFLLAVDYFLPAAIGSFHVWGLYLVTGEIGYGWLYSLNHRPLIASIYTTTSTALVLATLRTYWKLCTFSRTRGDVPSKDLQPPTQLRDKSIPFKCTREGELPTCQKGRCGGRWKPPRTHHCSQCGVCKLEWDHHCPWIGNCVSGSQSYHFLRLLLLTPLTITIAALPVLCPTYQHLRAALSMSWSDPWVLEHWWNWKWSWVIYGGPIGRYVAGTVYGYRALQRSLVGHGSTSQFGDVIKEPRLALLGSVVFAIFLAVFTLALGVQMISNIKRGETTLDVLKRRSGQSVSLPSAPVLSLLASKLTKESYVWIPRDAFSDAELASLRLPAEIQGGPFRGVPVSLEPGDRIYDLGKDRNWKRWLALRAPGTVMQANDELSMMINLVLVERLKGVVLDTFDGTHQHDTDSSYSETTDTSES